MAAATACTSAYQAPPGPLHADSAAILRDIAHLASDQLEGRLTGTPVTTQRISRGATNRSDSSRLSPATSSPSTRNQRLRLTRVSLSRGDRKML